MIKAVFGRIYEKQGKLGAAFSCFLCLSGLLLASCEPDEAAAYIPDGGSLAVFSEAANNVFAENATIYKNIFIDGVDVSGLTREQALSLLTESGSEAVLSFVADGGEIMRYPFADFDAKRDVASAVERAFMLTNGGAAEENAAKKRFLEMSFENVKSEYLWDEELLAQAVAEVDAQTAVETVDATFTRKNGEFIITDGISGKRIDAEKAAADARAILKTGVSGAVMLVMTEIPPSVTTDDYTRATDLIGSFSTTFTGALTLNRNINLKQACENLNDSVIMPGEVISTTDAFGPTTIANGYLEAGAYVNGHVVNSPGGGVCQVSSTFYNAALRAELEIVERRNHSMKVGYMDWAYDATLADGYIDLKIKNNTDYPVTVEAYIEGSKVVVNIYGHETRNPTRELKFSNQLVSTTPPGPDRETPDPELPLGERVVVTASVMGYRWQLYKSIYENGELIAKELVNTSVYIPFAGEVRVGTGPAAPSPSPENVPANPPPDAASSEDSDSRVPDWIEPTVTTPQ